MKKEVWLINLGEEGFIFDFYSRNKSEAIEDAGEGVVSVKSIFLEESDWQALQKANKALLAAAEKEGGPGKSTIGPDILSVIVPEIVLGIRQ